jgi:hypothetical protein
MNMMSVLLGATGVLLVAALALSFGSLNTGLGKDSTKDEIALLRAEVQAIRQQEDTLQALRHGKTVVPPPPVTTFVPPVLPSHTAEDDAILAAQNDALKEQIENLEEQVADSEKKVDVYRDEAGFIGQTILENNNSDQRRARLVREALLIATVTEWAEAEGFAVITIQRPDLVQEGSILGIRRNNGVLGQVQISQIYEGGQATADPHLFPGGLVDIQPGDELIVPPL